MVGLIARQAYGKTMRAIIIGAPQFDARAPID
jgi:hypothetical protein